MNNEKSKHVTTVKQKFRIGQKVWAYVMFDVYQFTITGYHEPTKQWRLQWLTGPGSFYMTEDGIFKRKPR